MTRAQRNRTIHRVREARLPNACHATFVRWFGAGILALAIASCGRTGLEPGEEEQQPLGSGGSAGASMLPMAGTGGKPPDMPDAEPPPPDAGLDAEPPPDAGLDAEPPPDAEPPSDAGTIDPEPGPDACVSSAETCNGVDDDCDGIVDEIPPVACADGGSQYCIAGTMSECPRRCEVCVPGGVRICQNSFCTFWGEQECTGDGQGFGSCRERQVPPECAAVAKKHKNSPELERCCLDNGYCCLDMFDLDGDGSRTDMVGNCNQVRCD
jgi:hypothetical protein